MANSSPIMSFKRLHGLGPEVKSNQNGHQPSQYQRPKITNPTIVNLLSDSEEDTITVAVPEINKSHDTQFHTSMPIANGNQSDQAGAKRFEEDSDQSQRKRVRTSLLHKDNTLYKFIQDSTSIGETPNDETIQVSSSEASLPKRKQRLKMPAPRKAQICVPAQPPEDWVDNVPRPRLKKTSPSPSEYLSALETSGMNDSFTMSGALGSEVPGTSQHQVDERISQAPKPVVTQLIQDERSKPVVVEPRKKGSLFKPMVTQPGKTSTPKPSVLADAFSAETSSQSNKKPADIDEFLKQQAAHKAAKEAQTSREAMENHSKANVDSKTMPRIALKIDGKKSITSKQQTTSINDHTPRSNLIQSLPIPTVPHELEPGAVVVERPWEYTFDTELQKVVKIKPSGQKNTTKPRETAKKPKLNSVKSHEEVANHESSPIQTPTITRDPQQTNIRKSDTGTPESFSIQESDLDHCEGYGTRRLRRRENKKTAGQLRAEHWTKKNATHPFMLQLKTLYPIVTMTNEIDNTEPPNKFQFIEENEFIGKAEEPDPQSLYGCSCTTSCGADCSCLLERPPKDSGALWEPPYTRDERLRHDYITSRLVIHECNAKCRCPETCKNRNVQFGRQIELEIFRTEGKGWGLRCPDLIQKGQFVDTYRGEVLTDARWRKRAAKNKKDVYFYALDKFKDDLAPGQKEYVVDGRKKGSPARFMNHSCDPNLSVQGVSMIRGNPRVYELAFFALKDIYPGEELTFDYQDGQFDVNEDEEQAADGEVVRQPCLCGADECHKKFW